MIGDPYRIGGPTCVSFSGGRTSAFMLWQLIERAGGALPPDTHVIFANTGREHPDTLAFVARCSLFWGVPIAWVEYDGHEGARDFREVTYETAAKDGEPFAELIQRKFALPNITRRFCTEVLKVERIRAFMRAKGFEQWTDCVGLRADEPRRVAKRRAANDPEVTYALPLDDAGVTVADVAAFWKAQPFDLEIPSTAGNCTLCFEKPPAILRAELQRDPSAADWWIEQERRAGRRFAKNWTYRELRDSALLPLEALTPRGRALATNHDDARCACTD